MGDKVTARFDQEQIAGFEALEENGEADSPSEAVRVAASVGLHELGYYNGESTEKQSRLSAAGELVGWVLGVVALSWLGVTIAYPVEMRLPAVAALCAALAAFGVARVADGRRWRVRDRLASVLGGERA